MALDATGHGSGVNNVAGGDAVGVVALGIAASLATAISMSVSRGRQKLEGISLMGIDETGAVVIPQQTMQWWPESLSDSLTVGWSGKAIPGATHDLVQWGGNAGRTITFTIKLTRTLRPDDDFSPTSGFGKVPISARGIAPSGVRDLPQNVDIKRMVSYLRAYCYPAYAGAFNQARPPVTSILHVPGLGLSEGGDDYIFAVMLACDVTYMRLFADGTPRLAEVSLSFKQHVQDVDGVHWKDRSILLDAAGVGTTRTGSIIPVASDRGAIPQTPVP